MTGKAYLAILLTLIANLVLAILTVYAAWNHNLLAAVPLGILTIMSAKFIIR